MKKINPFFIGGILLALFIIASYFIKITVEEGANYYIDSPLLGVIIFYNPFVLGLYILIAIALIIKGLRS